MDRISLTKEIIELQRQLNRIQRHYEQDAWMDLNLSIGQVKSLFFIAAQGTTNFGKLAAALGVTPPNVTGIVDRLVEKGLISRQENPDNRRMLMLQVTEKGEALIATLRERAVSQISGILENLRVEELNTVAQGLSLLVRVSKAHEEKYLRKKPGESR
jgi:DNA-binding MarR family transcriptional regulator